MVVDMAVLHVLADPARLGLGLVVSKILAAEVAMANNFVWNDLWTFRGMAADETSLAARLKRFLKFNLICSGGIAIAAVMLKLLAHGLGVNLYLANLAAIVTATAWNFGINYAFNWGGWKAGSQVADLR